MKMFNQLVGPEIRAKLKRWICYAICIALCVMLLPNMAGSMISACLLSLI